MPLLSTTQKSRSLQRWALICVESLIKSELFDTAFIETHELKETLTTLLDHTENDSELHEYTSFCLDAIQ